MKQKNPAAASPIFVSVAGARDRLGGISDSGVRALVRRGALDGRKIGTRLVITAASIDAFAARLPRVATGAPR